MPIDKIRIITNIASGVTGSLIAMESKSHGAKATRLMGQTQNIIDNQSVKIKTFRYVEEFRD